MTYNPTSHQGKTVRSRAKQARNTSNKQQRASWNAMKGASNDNFPAETCNGKRNRRKSLSKVR
jgi:hypothetical protein